MFYKRKYKPIYPQKYTGDHTNIIMRSSWETKFAIWCDKNPSILKWSSEETVVPYVSPVDNKAHRYFIDFKIQVKSNTGSVKTYLIEIKPASQAILERVGKNKYNQAQFVKNQAKWAAAQIWCKQQGIKFRIVSENDLFHNGKA